jgi:Domain of unknown function (DUF6487)
MSRHACPDCGASMEQGMIPDFSHAQILQLTWHRGEPGARKFLGMANGIKVIPEQQVPITADRCTKCGFLKLYAVASDDVP